MSKKNKFNHLLKDAEARTSVCKQEFSVFFHVYFGNYIKYDTAPFQKEMMSILQGDAQNVVITAFRGSGKSTISTLAYPLWCILNGSSKFILIMSKTQQQAEQHLQNLKLEFETNPLIKKDFGPFNDYMDRWSRKGIEISNFDVKVLAVSTETSIRGLMHNSHRPDLIIADDLEDVESGKTQKGRDRLYSFVKSEAIGAGDVDTRFVMLGNKVHKDAVIMRIKDEIDANKIDGIYREYPIVNKYNKPIWPGKFPNMAAIEKEKRRFGSETFWQREAMLNPISLGDRIIREGWLKYYDELPQEEDSDVVITIDPSLGESANSDYTAIVIAHAFGKKDNIKIYIDPRITNKRMTMNEMIIKAHDLHDNAIPNYKVPICVETVAYQGVIRQELKARGCRVDEVKPHRSKADRLQSVSHYFERGQIYFPKKGAEKMINQLLDFGSEAHDDLMDAVVYAIDYLMKKRKVSMGMCVTKYFNTPSTNFFMMGGRLRPGASDEEKREYYVWVEHMNKRGLL